MALLTRSWPLRAERDVDRGVSARLGAGAHESQGGIVNQNTTSSSNPRPARRLAAAGRARLAWAMERGRRPSEQPVARPRVGRRRQGHLQGRLDQAARQPQPVHRLRVAGVRDLVPHLRLARRLRPQDALADEGRGLDGSRHRLDGQRRRAHLDVHASARTPSGTTASRSRPRTSPSPTTTSSRTRLVELHRLHQPDREGDRDRRLHGASSCAPSPSRT